MFSTGAIANPQKRFVKSPEKFVNYLVNRLKRSLNALKSSLNTFLGGQKRSFNEPLSFFYCAVYQDIRKGSLIRLYINK